MRERERSGSLIQAETKQSQGAQHPGRADAGSGGPMPMKGGGRARRPSTQGGWRQGQGSRTRMGETKARAQERGLAQ